MSKLDYKEILENIVFKSGKVILKNNLEVINDNSSYYLQELEPGQIGTAITSPPYYNAREYSQWSTMLMYFVDMIINCKAVFNALAHNSYYLYNIGFIFSSIAAIILSRKPSRKALLEG